MKSFDPTNKFDCKDLQELNADDWMIKLLYCNPSYVFWGPHEDCMYKRSKIEGPDELGRTGDHGWESRGLYANWKDFYAEYGEPDNYNECVNFYFELDRKHIGCKLCNESGYHPDARWVSESFYRHSSPFKDMDDRSRQSAVIMAGFTGKLPDDLERRANYPTQAVLKKYGNEFRKFCEDMRSGDGFWFNKITQDEAEALFNENRIDKKGSMCPSASEINNAQYREGSLLMTHDAINSGILIKQRCKRLGLPLLCPDCQGGGYVYTAPKAHVNLVLWILHPRKGASKGVEIKNVQKSDLPEIIHFLQMSNQRNQERFSKLPVNMITAKGE